ncbi:MAG: hypothetical protein ACK4F4_03815 [Hylemonella sp.]|jgi:hypothetical protein|uniref:hypothetical protein n=1 Tax=Hylemonella sp. TaxID=2066020 RepID=UPI00391CB721
MLESEKVAIAAHLHVLLRRKTGRVTDTEWMAANAEYARAIIRFARTSAKEDGHPDLAEWAGKLESALGLKPPAADPEGPRSGYSDTAAGFPSTSPRPEDETGAPRYVRGIR